MRSLRGSLIVASLLWTAGLLMLMHLMSMGLFHLFPFIRQVNSPFMIGGGVCLMAVGFRIARGGLGRFAALHDELRNLRSGQQHRINESFPLEVQPLIDELNGLLDDRDRAVQRAFTTAGDLAHGLKTPLALLAREAGSNAAIKEHVAAMSRHVDYHLARARASAASARGTASCLAADSLNGLIRTVRKLYASRSLRFDAKVDEGLTVRMQREDFEEILGNVLDNACKWARSGVQIAASETGGSIAILVDDDGPGIPQHLREIVLQRGVRLDQSEAGSGLGLAIVRDLLEIYSGTVQLEESPAGGLRVRIQLMRSSKGSPPKGAWAP